MRKLAVAAAVSLALASGGAKALILGEINMRSALNQPMNAEIGLSSVESGELEGMIVKLASPEAFARAGIERTQALNDLKFTVVSGSGGQPVIRISSDKPVLEPFLNFLLEVDWTRGRMVREYTVLLDPPVFMTPTAQPRSTVGDTPVLVDSATEDSILNPVAIDRGDAAAPFDESSVVIVGDTGEVSDAQDGVAVDLGEVVDLGDVVELGGVAEVADGVTADSSVVSLDGLELEAGSTNDQAVSLTDPNAGQDSFTANADWEVAVLGDTAEVGDDVGAPISIDRVAVDTDSAASETVSLDELAPAGDAFVASTQSNAQPGSSVTVQQNDTLWEIATANKLQGMTTQQMMLALLEANEQAFMNGNINLVKAGAILRSPESNAVTSLSQSEAVAQVGVQEQLWREYRDNLRGASGASGDAQIAQNDAAAGNTGADAAAADAAAADAAAADADSATTVADAGDSAATATGADSQGAGATAGTDTDA
ncbi:MAG: hypothetical protein KTR33_10945, partial [Gammaproteobacteria bacterium]|nr:hypothetical protein [Gammaproteobacteria bacterium]